LPERKIGGKKSKIGASLTVSPIVNLPSSLRDLYRPKNEDLTYPELLAVCVQVAVIITDDDIKTIEVATHHQSKSTAWFAQILGSFCHEEHVCC